MSAELKTIVVEISGPQASGKTTLSALLARLVHAYFPSLHVALDGPGRDLEAGGPELGQRLQALGPRILFRETEYDDRDRELASLRQERDRLRQDVERLKAEVARQGDKARGFDQ